MASISRISLLVRCLRSSIVTPRLFSRNFSVSVPALIKPVEASQIKPADQLKFLKPKIKYTLVEDITPLKEAPALYATVHIHNRHFLVTEGDKISIPVRLRDVEVGDVLNFDQVSNIGSRDYTLSGRPRLDPRMFSIKGVVIEKSKAKRHILEKTRRRRRHIRHIIAKNPLTVIRISELVVRDVNDTSEENKNTVD